jgi:hypothetical protein
MRLVAGILVPIFSFQTATGAEETLLSLENRLANKMRLAVEISWETNQRRMPTNMVEIVPSLTMEAWAMMEEKFRRFEGQAGFSNSILEKYVILPPDVTFRYGPTLAEAVLMNAQPFQDSNGRTNRWVIHKIGEEIGQCLLSELKVQEMMNQAGAHIPTPQPMVSTIEFDAPRRQEEAQMQQEMEQELKRVITEHELGKGSSRPPSARLSPTAPERPKDKARKATPKSDTPSSRTSFLGIALVLIVGSVLVVFAFRQTIHRDERRK